MIHLFHEQVFERMPPERRARKLAAMKALAKSFRSKRNENENPLKNNMALPYFTHSTPVKKQQITDLDDVESEAELTTSEPELCRIEERDEKTFWAGEEEEEPKLLISKMYDLEDNQSGRVDSENSCDSQGGGENSRFNVTELKDMEDKNEKHWRSLEALHDTAEYEFCRSLEESKLFVSTSSLLEEIEAYLPSPYSLVKPLSHTFHTLTSYRTQTRLARMDSLANLTSREILKQNECLMDIPSKKIDRLEMEATVQKALAEQAEKALILSKTNKFFGVQHVECEKALLLANLRFDAVVQEAKKLRVLGETSEKENFGQITISDIYFEVNVATDYCPEKYICTATERENVQSTSVLCDIEGGTLHFNESLKFSSLSRDFVIYIDLFKLLHKQRKKALLTTALVRKLKKMTAGNLNKGLPASPYSRCGFFCIAQCELRLENIVGGKDEKCILQNYLTMNLPHSVAGSTVRLLVKTDIQLKSKKTGFLNVFKQTWLRQWYSQSGYFLESWLYPEDQESDKASLDSIYLPNCISVEAVGLEVCIRPHSFVIKLKENHEEILFSADSHQDLISWIDHLNLTIEQIRMWKPNI